MAEDRKRFTINFYIPDNIMPSKNYADIEEELIYSDSI